MAQILEWFQCKHCGRRQRWRAEIAGSEVPCQCGELIFCPELELFSDPGTLHDTALDSDGTAAIDAAAEGDDSEYELEDLRGLGRLQRKARGFLGMSINQEMVFWLFWMALGFALLVHALVLQYWWYIASTAVVVPVALFMLLRTKRQWQGNRSFRRAFEESLGISSDERQYTF